MGGCAYSLSRVLAATLKLACGLSDSATLTCGVPDQCIAQPAASRPRYRKTKSTCGVYDLCIAPSASAAPPPRRRKKSKSSKALTTLLTDPSEIHNEKRQEKRGKKDSRKRKCKRYKKAIDSSADEFLCPLTLELPMDPVMAEDGNVYERRAIEDFIVKNSSDLRSPVTGEPMGKLFFPAIQVRNVIERLVSSGAIKGEKAKRWTEECNNKKKVLDLRERAEGEDTDAMQELALCYSYGCGVEKDDSKAYYWCKKAADRGHVGGTALAGSYLIIGSGVAKNIPLGMVFLSRAEEAGSDVAAFCLGKWLCTGRHGLPQDQVQGMKLLKKVVRGTCKLKHLTKNNLEDARNILRKMEKMEDPTVASSELS